MEDENLTFEEAVIDRLDELESRLDEISGSLERIADALEAMTP